MIDINNTDTDYNSFFNYVIEGRLSEYIESGSVLKYKEVKGWAVERRPHVNTDAMYLKSSLFEDLPDLILRFDIELDSDV